MAKMDKLRKRAKKHFDVGERALSTVMGVYETKIMGTESVRTGVFIATDRRLLFYAKKVAGFDLEVFPYPHISSVEMGKNMMGHYIKFFASGNSIRMKWISNGDVRAFVEIVKQRMTMKPHDSSQSSEKPAVIDPLSQLERLGKLHKAGALTDEEFASKKAEILARI